MKDSTYKFLEKLVARYHDLERVKEDIAKAYLALEETYKNKIDERHFYAQIDLDPIYYPHAHPHLM